MSVSREVVAVSRKRKYVTHSDEVHTRIIELYLAERTAADTARITGVNVKSVTSSIRRYEADGQIDNKHTGGNHKAVISDGMKQMIVALQSSDHALRLCDIRRSLDLAFVDTPSLASMWRVLYDAGFTTKHLDLHAAPRNTLVMKTKRREWCRDVGVALTDDSVVFIDESPFSFCVVRGRGRSPRGQPAIAVTPQIRGKNHTVIAAMSPKYGLIYYEIKVSEPDTEFISKRKGSKKKKTASRGVNRDRFRLFLINLMTTNVFRMRRRVGRPFTLVFDNCRIHLGDIAETIFQTGHTQQLLPAWSPALNPIEYAFSKWKFAYRAIRADSEAVVNDAIDRSSSCITPIDCQHWFQHTQSLYAKCEAMEDL
jgi:transposase